jgi:hypothetical protein
MEPGRRKIAAMGLFDFLRGKDEKAIPEPGTPEFEAAVQGSAIPDSQSVEMGESGWASAEAAKRGLSEQGIDAGEAEVTSSETIDLSDSGARERVVDVLRQHGIDPDNPGERQIDASTVPGLQEAIFGALGEAGFKIPGAGGFGGGVSAPEQDPLAVVEELAKRRDAGEITQAEFEAQKKRLLGS